MNARQQTVEVSGILAPSGFLNAYKLTQNGYANTYYAAAVRSMLLNWRNFFFVSFDPGGLVSVDKPPLALWVQAASAKLFGFSSASILLPEALAGVASVGLLYLWCSATSVASPASLRRWRSRCRRCRSQSPATTTPMRCSCSCSSPPPMPAPARSSRAGYGRCCWRRP